MIFKIKNPIAFWYKLAQSLAAVGMVLWLLETAYFLILEGWHWKATNPAEVWADYVVQSIFGGVFVAMGLCLIELIEDRVRLDRHWEELSGKMEGALKGLSDDDLKPMGDRKTMSVTRTDMGLQTDDGLTFLPYKPATE